MSGFGAGPASCADARRGVPEIAASTRIAIVVVCMPATVTAGGLVRQAVRRWMDGVDAAAARRATGASEHRGATLSVSWDRRGKSGLWHQPFAPPKLAGSLVR